MGGGVPTRLSQREVKRQDQRLREVAELLGWDFIPVAPDGACQFAALAMFVPGATASALRQLVVESFTEKPPPYMKGAIVRTYLDLLSRPATCGDRHTLQRAAEITSTNVYLLHVDRPDVWELMASPANAQHTAFVTYRTGHYDAMVPPDWVLDNIATGGPADLPCSMIFDMCTEAAQDEQSHETRRTNSQPRPPPARGPPVREHTVSVGPSPSLTVMSANITSLPVHWLDVLPW